MTRYQLRGGPADGEYVDLRHPLQFYHWTPPIKPLDFTKPMGDMPVDEVYTVEIYELVSRGPEDPYYRHWEPKKPPE